MGALERACSLENSRSSGSGLWMTYTRAAMGVLKRVRPLEIYCLSMEPRARAYTQLCEFLSHSTTRVFRTLLFPASYIGPKLAIRASYGLQTTTINFPSNQTLNHSITEPIYKSRIKLKQLNKMSHNLGNLG